MHSKTLSINTHHLVLMANVKDAPFKCSSCKKVFISENHLKRHQDRRHNSKTPSIPSEQVKEGTIYETANESTIKAVLNATERIEDLLVKLAIRDHGKNTDVPVACSSPCSNFDYSQVSSSSFCTEKNIENINCISNDSISSKKQIETAALKHNDRSNFNYSQVTSSSLSTGKNKLNIESINCISNDSIPSKKQIEVAKLKYNERSNFEDTFVTSNSFTIEKNEQNMENFECISNDSIPCKKQIEIAKLKYNEWSNFEDTFVTSNSFTIEKNEQNMENFECFSNDSISNKVQMEIAKLEYKERNNLEDTLVNSNSFAIEKNEQNIENFGYFPNDITFSKEQKEIADLKYYEKINLGDGPVVFDSFTAEKSKKDMESCEYISNDDTSKEKQKEMAELKPNERNDYEDTQVASDSFTQENSGPHMESSGCISIDSIPFKKSRNITKMTFNDFLADQENKAIWRLTSSIINSSNFSLDVLDSPYSENDQKSERNELITHRHDSFLQKRPMRKSCESVKSEILRKLNSKLESYGVDTSRNTLSNKDMMRIGSLLKEERDRIAEEIPDYHKLRQLIKDNAHRRIKENLQVHSTYVA